MKFTKPRWRRYGQRRLKTEFTFNYESRDTLKLFTLFLAVKTITKLNPQHSDKFEIIKKLAVLVHVLQTTQTLVLHSHCSAL